MLTLSIQCIYICKVPVNCLRNCYTLFNDLMRINEYSTFIATKKIQTIFGKATFDNACADSACLKAASPRTECACHVLLAETKRVKKWKTVQIYTEKTYFFSCFPEAGKRASSNNMLFSTYDAKGAPVACVCRCEPTVGGHLPALWH